MFLMFQANGVDWDAINGNLFANLAVVGNLERNSLVPPSGEETVSSGSN